VHDRVASPEIGLDGDRAYGVGGGAAL